MNSRGNFQKTSLFPAQAVLGRAAAAAILPLLLSAGAVRVVSAASASVPAASFTSEPPKTEEEKAIYQIYKQSLEADRLFGRHEYAKSIPLYEAGLKAMQNIAKRHDASAPTFLFEVHAGELTAALKYSSPDYAKVANLGMDTLTYSGLMKKMLELACQITGHKTDIPDVFLPSTERLVSDAYQEVHETTLPVPDDQWQRVVAKLEMAEAKLAGVLQRNPEYKNDLIDRSSYPDITGEKALAEVQQKLAEARPELEKASARMLKAVPAQIQGDLAETLKQIEKMTVQAKEGALLPAREADLMIGDRAQYLKDLTKRFQNEYAQSGKTLSPEVLQPIIGKLNLLQAAVESRAPQNTFPAGQTHDEVLEASVRRQLAHNVPEAKVLKTAMFDPQWEIIKNDLNIPKLRRKAGWVLYKMPHEKWARLYRVVYSEDYSGGGTYARAEGADQYPFVRWQKVEGGSSTTSSTHKTGK